MACIRRCAAAGFAQVLQHHHAAPEGADRVGQALAHDVEGRAVDRLEHRRVAALGVDVAGGRDAQAAGQRGGQVAQDVGMQVGGDQRVQRGRAVDHARGGGVDQFLVPAHIGELLGDLQPRSRPTSPSRGAARCDLVTTVSSLRGRDCASWKAKRMMRSTPARVIMRHVGGHLDRVALVRAAADAGVFALGVLAHDHPVQVFGPAALRAARRCRAGCAWAARWRTGRSPGRSSAAGPTA